MVDSTLIEILGVVIAVFFGAVITLMIYFDKSRRQDITDGFAQVNKRFDKVDKRIDMVDKRIDMVDQRIDGVDQRINMVDQRIDGVDQRINGLILHLVPKPIPGVIQAVPEPSAEPEPERRAASE